ncbi:hypothetical protein EYF80_007349 [Liparis tanakae]|uniref:Uncharacterized protein n=1 Tax=Liparis tanakae TaxID=230148 RepID=A0A4Z2IYB6_9TELE|nr:hypothetical protein EYF80_007349 [Liparis tanakae]
MTRNPSKSPRKTRDRKHPDFLSVTVNVSQSVAKLYGKEIKMVLLFPPTVEAMACSLSMSLFFFIRRFWNQIFTCWSLRFSRSESSLRRCLVMNSFSINSPSSSAS